MSYTSWDWKSPDNRNTPAYHGSGRVGRYMEHTIKDEGVDTSKPRIKSNAQPSEYTDTSSPLKVPITPGNTGTAIEGKGKRKMGRGELIPDNTHSQAKGTFKAPPGLGHKPLSKHYVKGYGLTSDQTGSKLSSYRGTNFPGLIQTGGTNEFDIMSPEHKYRYEAFPNGTMTNDVTTASNYQRQIDGGVFPKSRAEEYNAIPMYGAFQPDTTSDRTFSNVYVSVGSKNSHMYRTKYRDIAAMPLESGFIHGN